MKDRRKLSEGLRQRTQETYDTREDRRRGIINFSKAGSLPRFNPDIGEHLIDVLPYFAGTNDPVKNEGDPTYLVDLFVHRFIGPNEDDFICLFRTYGKPCPICEYREKLRRIDNPSEDIQAQIDAARAKRYSVYAIWDRDNESKGVQLWTVAHWFFQNNLMGICTKPRTGSVVAFADPSAEEGRSIFFKISGSKTQQQWSAFQFVERDDDIPDNILDSVPALDELLDMPSYEQVKKAFWAGLDEEETEADAPQPGTPTRLKRKEVECPYGGVFGQDFEKFPECLDDCDKYAQCNKIYVAEYAEDAEELAVAEEVYPSEQEEDDFPEPDSPRQSSTRRRRR